MAAAQTPHPTRTWLPAIVAFAAVASGCGDGGGKGEDSAATLPDGPLQYQPIATWEQMNFEDRAARWYLPPDPKGLVVFFHGSDGNVSIVSHIEVVAFLNEMILAGVGFVATDGSSPAGDWTADDLARTGRLYEELVATTDLDPNDALFASGFSAGGAATGDFAALALDRGWPLKAVNPNQANCWTCRDLGVPTVWVLNDNDPHPEAYEHRGDLRDDGVAAEIHEVHEQVLDGSSFLKHPSMTAERSQGVFDDLVAKELIGPDGVRIVPDDQADQYCNWYGANGESYIPDLRAEELRVLWALHRFAGEHSRQVRDFFLDAS